MEPLVRWRLIGLVLAGIGAYVITSDLLSGTDPAARQVDLTWGGLLLLGGIALAWVGFADEAGMPGRRLGLAATMAGVGVVLGAIVGAVVAAFA